MEKSYKRVVALILCMSVFSTCNRNASTQQKTYSTECINFISALEDCINELKGVYQQQTGNDLDKIITQHTINENIQTLRESLKSKESYQARKADMEHVFTEFWAYIDTCKAAFTAANMLGKDANKNLNTRLYTLADAMLKLGRAYDIPSGGVDTASPNTAEAVEDPWTT